jgi:biotin synthase
MAQSRTGATLVDTPTAAHNQPDAVENAARKASSKKILQDAVAATGPRQNWTRDEISAIYYQPLLELAHQAVS